MRKIDKSKILSFKYKNWLDSINLKAEEHPKDSKFKIDVKMNLYFCQKGVCAYTEIILCNPELLNENNWKNGEFIKKDFKVFGDLEHFNPNLKKNKYWEWDNLFMVCHEVNNLKGIQSVDEYYDFKPDSLKYDPFKVFDYDFDTHTFIPKISIKNEKKRNNIKNLIKLLSINHDMVIYKRETFFNELKYNDKKIINEFFTAYDFYKLLNKKH